MLTHNLLLFAPSSPPTIDDLRARVHTPQRRDVRVGAVVYVALREAIHAPRLLPLQSIEHATDAVTHWQRVAPSRTRARRSFSSSGPSPTEVCQLPTVTTIASQLSYRRRAAARLALALFLLHPELVPLLGLLVQHEDIFVSTSRSLTYILLACPVFRYCEEPCFAYLTIRNNDSARLTLCLP